MCQDRFDPSRFHVFDALAEPQLLTLRRVARLSRVPRRQRIYRVGEASDRLLFLQAGIVKVAVPPPLGPDMLLAFLHPGDVFGESALVDAGPRDHLTEACEDAAVWSVGRATVLDLISQSPMLGVAFLELMARRNRRLSMRVEELLHKDAHRRVAQVLLNLAADRSVKDADGLLIPLRMTQSDLANMAGLARETVNIVLRNLRTCGLVEMTRDNIRLRRPAALRSVQTTPAPIRPERHYDDNCYVPPFGGQLAVGADAYRMERDARDAFDSGASRAALGARSHRL